MQPALAATALLVAGVFALSAPPIGHAAPVTEGPRSPVVMRRIGLVVHDMDASLKLYRDALGFRTVSDRTVRTSAQGAQGETTLRVVLLRGDDDYAGLLQLVYYVTPQHTPRSAKADGQHAPGDLILLFSMPDVERVFESARAVPGVRVVKPPHLLPSLTPGAKGDTELYAFLYDPDGNWFELNQSTDPRAPKAP